MERVRLLRIARACLVAISIAIGFIVVMGLLILAADGPYAEEDHFSQAMAGADAYVLLCRLAPVGVVCLIAALGISYYLKRHAGPRGPRR